MIRVLAPAKINPYLDLLWKRDDGFHEIETFMVAIDVCDELEVRATRDARISIDVDGPHASADIPRDAQNLVVRTATLCLNMAREQGRVPLEVGLDLRLTKKIPSQSGLGGASSDAAAAWLGACTALDVAFDSAASERALAALGSDTVFFRAAADTGAAWCTGRGECVSPVHAPQSWTIALVVPEVACPTARIYAGSGIPLRGAGRVSSLQRLPWSSTPAHDARALLANRLEATAIAVVPEMASWRALLDEAGASHFRMSGSGSAWFGLYEDSARARFDLERIEELARGRGLSSRLCDVVRPCGHGVRLLANR